MTKDNVKTKGKALSKDTRTAIKNLVRLVESTALLIVAGYSYFTVQQAHFGTVGQKVVGFASILIGLRGAELFVRHLANK